MPSQLSRIGNQPLLIRAIHPWSHSFGCGGPASVNAHATAAGVVSLTAPPTAPDLELLRLIQPTGERTAELLQRSKAATKTESKTKPRLPMARVGTGNPCASRPTPSLCIAIPGNCAFLAKVSKSSCRMTNEKFSMTNFQFRLSALVAACRTVPLHPGVFASISYCPHVPCRVPSLRTTHFRQHSLCAALPEKP